MIDAAAVAAAHDAMREEYDLLRDLWYAHLFDRVHDRIVRHLLPGAGRRALDVGCGTGIQSVLLALAGYEVRGIDLAGELIAVARGKAAQLGAGAEPQLPQTVGPYRGRQKRHAARFSALRGDAPIVRPTFEVADARSPAAYAGAPYDVICCCGSVLSFIDDVDTVLGTMSAALAPGGLLFVEVEQRWNLDLVWPAVDRLVRGRLGYEQDWTEIAANACAPPDETVRIEYPFELRDGRQVVLPLWLFSVSHLDRLFRRHGLRVVDRAAVHAVTNLIPSTVLHRADPSSAVRALFAVLARIDERLESRWPVWRLGCSAVYVLSRGNEAPHPAAR